MKCSKTNEILSAYGHGELPGRLHDKVEAHLEACESCRREYQRLEATSRLLRSTLQVEPPPFLLTRTMARVRAETRRVGWALGEALKVRHLMPVATAALLVLVMSAGVLPRDGGPDSALRPEDPMTCWVDVAPVMHGEASVAFTMEDLRSRQPISSGDYILAMGALQELPDSVASVRAELARDRVTHILDFEEGGRIESEITFSEE